ncbi:hypothetical protein EC973_002118 [Apophysomyces ossiformis]|uniref:V-SNARE coiled-coil homology domain-containing protein n=1 Tax=Apophysomyces ossiformis TaxID=679940 RepID=A0A8H7EN43_9FUNG|nr:hypothetical protein EC973_002118 [Apophysomyces ossiformis]
MWIELQAQIFDCPTLSSDRSWEFRRPFLSSSYPLSLYNQFSKMSEPYDPYIPNTQRGQNQARGGGNAKTQQVQKQVDEVVNIMQENIDKVMQRGERLDDLRGKTEDLQATAGHFRRGANQVRKRMWWKDLKWKIIIAVTILAILGIIIGSIVGTQTNKNNQQ